MSKKETVEEAIKAASQGCPVCGGWNYPGGLCGDCRDAEREAEERQKRAARHRAFGGWDL